MEKKIEEGSRTKLAHSMYTTCRYNTPIKEMPLAYTAIVLPFSGHLRPLE